MARASGKSIVVSLLLVAMVAPGSVAADGYDPDPDNLPSCVMTTDNPPSYAWCDAGHIHVNCSHVGGLRYRCTPTGP